MAVLNRYPLWKWLIIIAVVIPGLLYALPNIYGDDPGIQVRGTRGQKADETILATAQVAMEEAKIPVISGVADEHGVKLRFHSTEEQLKARDLLQRALGQQFTVALTLLPSTPDWLSGLGGVPMYLGLDLRGGVHFLLEVDMESAYTRAEERYVADLRSTLREAKIRYRSVHRDDSGKIELRLRQPSDQE
ncbi:MAG: hypothetical protein QF387_03590, partial [Arenicellales bacterium]|nr:hypothetical protein [Arenicellales bacterium]